MHDELFPYFAIVVEEWNLLDKAQKRVQKVAKLQTGASRNSSSEIE